MSLQTHAVLDYVLHIMHLFIHQEKQSVLCPSMSNGVTGDCLKFQEKSPDHFRSFCFVTGMLGLI